MTSKLQSEDGAAGSSASAPPDGTSSPAALLRGNMARVFSERDPQRRLAAVRELYSAGATLYEPQAVATGHAAISDAVGELLATLPAKMIFTSTGAEGSHHGLAFARWQGGVAGGPAVVTGMDVAHLEDGLIVALHVFVDDARG